jgi:hypothetical protein
LRHQQHPPSAAVIMSLHMPEDAASVLEQFMHDGKSISLDSDGFRGIDVNPSGKHSSRGNSLA